MDEDRPGLPARGFGFTGRWKSDSEIGAQILIFQVFLINSVLTAFFVFMRESSDVVILYMIGKINSIYKQL